MSAPEFIKDPRSIFFKNSLLGFSPDDFRQQLAAALEQLVLQPKEERDLSPMVNVIPEVVSLTAQNDDLKKVVIMHMADFLNGLATPPVTEQAECQIDVTLPLLAACWSISWSLSWLSSSFGLKHTNVYIEVDNHPLHHLLESVSFQVLTVMILALGEIVRGAGTFVGEELGAGEPGVVADPLKFWTDYLQSRGRFVANSAIWADSSLGCPIWADSSLTLELPYETLSATFGTRTSTRGVQLQADKCLSIAIAFFDKRALDLEEQERRSQEQSLVMDFVRRYVRTCRLLQCVPPTYPPPDFLAPIVLHGPPPKSQPRGEPVEPKPAVRPKGAAHQPQPAPHVSIRPTTSPLSSQGPQGGRASLSPLPTSSTKGVDSCAAEAVVLPPLETVPRILGPAARSSPPWWRACGPFRDSWVYCSRTGAAVPRHV